MKKRLIIMILLVLMVCVATWTIAGQGAEKGTENKVTASQGTDQKMDENSFIQQFAEAYKANDQAKMEALVKQAGVDVVYKAAISQAGKGISSVAEGKDGNVSFNTAEAMATVCAKVFKEEGLIDLVRKYKQYTPEMCKEKLRGDDLIDQGISLYEKSKWQEALQTWTEALKIYKKIGDVAGESGSLIGIGNVYDSLGQYAEALRYHQQSLEIKRKIKDVAGEGSSLIGIGNVYYSLGQYTEALTYYQQSLEIQRKIKDVAGEAASLNNIGNVYYSLGQYDEALTYYQQSLEIKRKIKDVAGEARSLNNIGLIYDNLGQYSEALMYFKQSLEIQKKIKDVSGEGSSLIGIGNVYKSLGQYTEALTYYQQSLEIQRKIKDVAGEGGSLLGIGNVYDSLGQYSEALMYFKQSLEIQRKIKDVAGETDSLNNIGNVYYSLGQYTEALTYYQQSLEIQRKIKDVAGEGRSLGNIGLIYDNLGQYSEALTYHQQSLEIQRKIKDVAGEGRSLNNIGNVYKHLGQYDETLTYYQQSLEIGSKIDDVAGLASSFMNIGLLCNDLGQYAKAIQPLQESIKISEQIGALETIWRGYRGLGAAFWKSGKLEQAVGSYEKAIATIEQLYASTSGLKEEERSSMIGEKSFVYQEFIELLLELHRKFPNKGYDKQAFRIAEKGKSRTFQELMAKAGAKIAFAGEAKDETFKKMIEKEQQLIREITSLQGLLFKEMSKPEKQRNEDVVKSLKEQLSKAEKTLIDLEKEIDSKYPRYADLKRPKPLTVEDLQEILKPGETVIAYAMGKEKVVVFVISKDRFKLLELETKPEELVQLIKEFRHGLENVHDMKDLEEFKPETAYNLYQKLMAPLLTDLKGITKLYIAADGILYTLPFEALVDQEVNKEVFREARRQGRSGQGPYLGEYATLHYLVDTYTITYLPSASMLRSLRKYEKPGYGKWTKPLIAFADPIFSLEEKKGGKHKGITGKGMSSETQLTVQILTRSTGADVLERLEESAEEAGTIAKEVKGKNEDMYLRDKATEENVYKTKLKEARYLLFSTHGLIGGDFKGVAEPALVLTLIGNPPGKDGFLCMSEVLGLDLNSELVILSACNTSGKGDKAGQGEGFVGLTRSFMYAGTRAILVTHWSVESQAARDLMVDSFKAMQKTTRPEALRQAKLKMKSSTRDDKGVPNAKLSLAHPFFWAPFVLVGEGI